MPLFNGSEKEAEMFALVETFDSLDKGVVKTTFGGVRSVAVATPSKEIRNIIDNAIISKSE